MVLFSFADNMDVDEFAKTVPSAKKIGIARLPGYKFMFNRTADDQSSKANIGLSADPNDVVWGVLTELNDNEKSKFYNGQAWTFDFKLEHVNCIGLDDKVHPAEAFVAQPHAVNTHLLPYDWYHQKVVSLAKNAGLPNEYIHKMSLMPFKVDPDEDRREKRLKKQDK
jgi:gamma-glutamylcyclotransferase